MGNKGNKEIKEIKEIGNSPAFKSPTWTSHNQTG